ncbi:arylsulfatase B-like [Glandiceps talaboti]
MIQRNTKIQLLYFNSLTCQKEKKPPHIVIIVVDDWGWGDVGFHHGSRFATPFIDELAYNGVILHNYYGQPLCTPARASLMTGRYPIHLGLQHFAITGAQPFGLRLNETIMPQYLHNLGYSTHALGKWHLGHFTKEHTPTHRGFDSFFGYYNGYHDYYDRLHQDTGTWGFDFRRNDELDYTTYGYYITELLTSEALTIIDQSANSDKPMFMYLCHTAVIRGNTIHPLEAPDVYTNGYDFLESETRQQLAGMVAALDDSTSRVVQALKDNNMYDNSIIIVTTDNGGAIDGYDNNDASNWPLRGGKNSLWEGGIRGTAFIHSPLLNLKGQPRVMTGLMHLTDWVPTLYHAAGGDMTDLPDNLDGFDLWDTIANGVPSPRTEILHNIDPIFQVAALRVGDYKIVVGEVHGQNNSWYRPDELTQEDLDSPLVIDCGQRPDDALQNCQPNIKPCLFDISKDPCEFNNLAESQPDILQRLLSVLDKYDATAVEPMFPDNDPAADPAKHHGAWDSWVDPSCPADVEKYGQYF